MRNLQFDIADLDSYPPQTIERLTATVYDSSDSPIGNIVYEAPTTGNLGDGEVITIDFGTLAGIRKLYIEVDNVGTVPEAIAYGWGLDNLQFEIVLSVPLDIKPQGCPSVLNTKNKGLLPVAILGTTDFDVNDIDVSTVQLEGFFPLRYNFEDVATPFNGGSLDDCSDCTQNGPDGLSDLTLKYDTQSVLAAIGEVNNGNCIRFTITGNLWDGTPFEGTDLVFIRERGKSD